MANAKVTRWTCDRCQRVVTTEGPNEPMPLDWFSIGAGPVGLPSDRGWEICGPCFSQVTRLLEPTDRPGANA